MYISIKFGQNLVKWVRKAKFVLRGETVDYWVMMFVI